MTEVLVPYGWSDRVAALYNSVAGGRLRPARVVRIERSHASVFDGATRLVPLVGADRPAVGDWVATDDNLIRDILPRWSALARTDPDPSGRPQVLAANVDLVLITAPADRASPGRVERELAMAWECGAAPVVVVTKADLNPQLPGALAGRLLGVDVIGASAVTGGGIDDLRHRLAPNRTAVLLGPSGAGKSSLANALMGDSVQATGAVRDDDRRGRHTTTSRQLMIVPGGGVLIDTPGLRSLALAGADVESVFPEIETVAAGCRFSDCSHELEPGCAVLAAVADGRLDRDRLNSWRKLQREVAADRRRRDPMARQETIRVHKQRTKEFRRSDKRRM
ncbi:MAG TPA: ribosome small subunit-dependent GTPase A [Acidimicrobiales bacterium]|nr:ribosome small subunit-dependent GTPase A [Acidimicrobiales bacterium]